MQWPHRREFQAVSAAPIKKLPASSGVGLPGVPVPDRGRKKVYVSFCYLRTGGSNPEHSLQVSRQLGRDGLRAVPFFSLLRGQMISRTAQRPSLSQTETAKR
jgi:hypothetical protein